MRLPLETAARSRFRFHSRDAVCLRAARAPEARRCLFSGRFHRSLCVPYIACIYIATALSMSIRPALRRLECKEVKKVTISSKNQIVIPREARQALGVKGGHQLMVAVAGDVMILLQKPN